MFPYKKALVTGGAGFIGSHIVERLTSIGVEVISIDSYITGKRTNLDHIDSKLLNQVDCDILDREKLSEYFDDVEIVFHNAASKKTVCLLDPRLDLDTNAKGTFNLLELSREKGIKKFIHASTGSVYGEGQYFPQDERHPLNPNSYYGVSKLAGERYAMAFHALYDLDVTVLRYFHVYGPRQESGEYGGVVAIFCNQLLNGNDLTIFGDGSQIRSFTYVEDVVDINLFIAQHPETKGQVYNCASGVQITIKELAEKLIQISGAQNIKIRFSDWTKGDIKFFKVSNEKLHSLGFEFNTEYHVGIEKTYKWFEKFTSK